MQNGKQQPNSCEAYKFEAKAGKRQIDSILVPILKKTVKKEQWNLGDREYRDLNANLLFELLTTASMRVLWLDFNKRPTIISEIAFPVYTHLTALYLGDNNVASISALARLEAPLLEKLYLNHNKITCLKALRMSHLPNLTELNLNGNIIVEESWLALCHFPKTLRLNLGYVNKKQELCEENWYVRSEFNDQTSIQTPKVKLGIFTPKMLKNIQPKLVHKTSQQKNLFKTFQS